MSIISGANAVTGAGAVSYQIERSLRFNSADSAYLNRTAGTPTSNIAWTYSKWIKRGLISAGSNMYLIHAQNGGNTLSTEFFVATDNTIVFREYGPSAYTSYLQTTQVFRDPSAWYHIVLVYNAANATSGNRVRLYVNGTRITPFSTETYPSSTSQATAWNTSGNVQKIGYSGTNTFDGYMTEINFIDGQALDPTSFGEYNSDTGVWQPIAYTGTYGNNGFYLNFSDNSNNTAATLGKDYSGNGNNWTPNLFSVTAGAGNDSLVDTPTNYGTDTGAGGEVRGNYCTMNPLDKGAPTVSNGNLQITYATASWAGARATMAVPKTGKWKWEVTPTTMVYSFIGIAPQTASVASNGYTGTNVYSWYLDSGEIRYSNVNQVVVSVASAGDVCEFRVDEGVVSCYRNGTLQHTFTQALTDITADYFPATWIQSGAVQQYNFGQRPFAYTASGFKALCTQNLPEPTVVDGGDYFNTVLWTGNGATQTITTGLANDLVWTKDRGAAYDHTLFDVIRTPGYFLRSNATSAEEYRADSLTAFTSTGFSVGADSVRQNINKSGNSYVSWAWKANGSGVANGVGTIPSTVSANTTAGFSIVTYTGNGLTSSGQTIGHGLGATPAFIITKKRSSGTDYNWSCWHKSLGGNYGIWLNLTNARNSNMWGGYTNFSFSVFTPPDLTYGNENGATYVNYLFAEVPGYSAFGSYTGNGSSDGVFVYLGMRPSFLMLKRTDSSDNWYMYDTTRDSFNVVDRHIHPNLSNAEGTGLAFLDILSNGFKLRQSYTALNASGGTYIYAAFAENPFKYALAR